jgi:photosystem II stability/assembly factor-like uncharacterized protein
MRKMMMICGMLLILSGTLAAQDNDEPEENIDARAAYRLRMRADTHGQVPFGALLNVKRELDSRRASKDRTPHIMDAGISGWEWLGPGNIGGRIRSIAIHPTAPQTMLVASVTGGIWRTFNGGDSWSPVNDFLPNLSVTSIVIDPTNPSVMYAGTGEGFPGASGHQGAGIFKSLDAGLTWSQLPSTNNNGWEWVDRLAHHPFQANTLLAVTGTPCTPDLPGGNCGGQLQRSTDGGNTWVVVYNFPNRPTDVLYDPNDPNIIVVGTLFDVYISVDGGLSFTNQCTGASGKLPVAGGSGQFRCEAAFAKAGGPGLCYVSMGRNNGEIWRTLDSGRTWTLRNTGTAYLGGQGNYDNTLWVDPTNPNLLVVGGIDIWRSLDGGSTFKKISRWQNFNNGSPANSAHADQHTIVSHPGYNGTTNRVVYFGNDGGIQVAYDIATVDTTSGWTNLANDLGITQFYGGSAAPDGSIIVGGAQDNDKLHYTPANGIYNWRQPTTGDAGFTAVNYFNPSQIFGEYTNLSMRRSIDGGASYQTINNGLGDAGNGNNSLFISPFTMDPNDPTILVAGGSTIWKTTNSGDNWFSIRAPLASNAACSAIDIAPGNTNLIWVGYVDGTVSRSIDGGTSWADVNVGGMPGTAVTDIAINPSLQSDAMVTFGGYQTNHIWFTSNGGLTWEARNGVGTTSVPALQINTVRFHPFSQFWVYVGTDLGIFASEDKGVTWNVLPLYPNGEGPVNVEVDELFWQGTDYLLAATHGRGMFRTRPQLGVFIDQSNSANGDGTFANPFHYIQTGINAQIGGTPILIKTGTYQQGPLIFSKRGKVSSWDGPVIIK